MNRDGKDGHQQGRDHSMSGSTGPLTPENPRKSGEEVGTTSSETNCFDWSETLRSFQGNVGLLTLVMETFLEEVPSLQRRIVDAIDRGDPGALKIAAHSLKGAFRYLGVSAAFEHAFRLERMAELKDLAVARELLPAIQYHIIRVSSAVADYLKRTE